MRVEPTFSWRPNGRRKSQVMSQVLDFRSVSRATKAPPRPQLRGDDTGEFWLEVSRSDSSDEPLAADPANAPGRVLLEVFVVLAVTALLAVAVTWLVPGPALP